jgi:hypothetical protein
MSWLAMTLIALAPPSEAPSIVEVEEVQDGRSILVLDLETEDEALAGAARADGRGRVRAR